MCHSRKRLGTCLSVSQDLQFQLNFSEIKLPQPDGDIRSIVDRLSCQVLRDLKNDLITQEDSLWVVC